MPGPYGKYETCLWFELLVQAASLNNQLNSQTLSGELSDGVGAASTARIDLRWSLTRNYAATSMTETEIFGSTAIRNLMHCAAIPIHH